MNDILINNKGIDVIILEDGTTLKMPLREALEIMIRSSNDEDTQELYISADKGQTIITGCIINKTTIKNSEGYSDEFLPNIGDKVLHENKIGEIYAFKNKSEVIIKYGKQIFATVHVGEVTFISRKINFLDKIVKYFD